MHQVLLCTCRAIVLLIKAFVLPRRRCRCRRGLLKVPIGREIRAHAVFMSEISGHEQSPILRNQSPIFISQSPIFENQSPILRNQSPILRNQSPILRNQSPILRNQCSTL